jgi:CrcB protein
MSTYLWIALGSALGGMARYGCSGWVAERYGERFPWGTLVVNVVGSFVIGVFAAAAGRAGWLGSPAVGEFVMIGVCGGYTTFSSVSLQTLNLARDGEWLPATANIVLSVVLCFISVALGLSAARALDSLGSP